MPQWFSSSGWFAVPGNQLKEIRNHLQDISQRLDATPLETATLIQRRADAATQTKEALKQAREQLHSTQAQMRKLEDENQRLQGQIANSNHEMARLQRVSDDLEAQVSSLRTKEVRLRTIVLDKAGEKRVTDQEVLDTFTKLRQKVQALSSSRVYGPESNVLIIQKLLENDPHETFYQIWSWGLGSNDLRLRMRAELFLFIQQHLLSHRWFGVPNEAQVHLQSVENALEKCDQVSTKSLAEWRICTLETLSTVGRNYSPATTCAHHLHHLFQPFIRADTPEDKVVRLESEILTVCKLAFDLAILMRKSKEGYKIEIPLLGNSSKLSDWRHLAEGFAVEKGKAGDESDNIAYTLFGALTKHAEYRGEEKRILEKAQVVLVRKEEVTYREK